MWVSRTKGDLMIEVWEKLDCESVGAAEIEAIEGVVEDVFGTAAVDSPMIIARLLADEGAELRHSEIMELFVKRASTRTFEPAFADLGPSKDLGGAESSIKLLASLRRKYESLGDKAGARAVRDKGIELKRYAVDASESPRLDAVSRQVQAEIAEWFTVWLQTPDLFADWLAIRQASEDFRQKFGRVERHDH
jgi:hypothetical protein